MTTFRLAASLAPFTLAALAACSSMSPAGPRAVATLQPTQGNTAAGTVDFQQQGDKVQVNVKLSGLKPNQEHGFHVHEKGDCSSADGMSAGGHFNPTGKPHGAQEAEHHAGDMPAIQSDAGGNATASFTLSGVGIGAGPADLVGHGVIVHAAPDDYKTQPTGNSGARIACGVIKPA
jgi:Cu-Zn family superoxide dismutase